MNFFTLFKQFKKIFSTAPKIRRGGLSVQDREDIKIKWQDIEQQMALGKPSNFKTAILEADKLLDHVLKGLGYGGQTMGDRMKSIPRNKFDRSFFDDMWQAHKVRNEMVHNMNYEVMDFEARRVIGQFKRVLGELGVL